MRGHLPSASSRACASSGDERQVLNVDEGLATASLKSSLHTADEDTEGGDSLVSRDYDRSLDGLLTVGPGSEGGAMLILAVHETQTLTQKRYEQVVRRLTNGKSHIEFPSDLPFDGLLVHAAGEGPYGFCIFDVFESEDAVERFRAAMGTIPEEVGIEEPPKFFPAHTVFVA